MFKSNVYCDFCGAEMESLQGQFLCRNHWYEGEYFNKRVTVLGTVCINDEPCDVCVNCFSGIKYKID